MVIKEGTVSKLSRRFTCGGVNNSGTFEKAGYHTACVGKWHLGHLPEFMPLKHGFDYFMVILILMI